jgi:hypothetical protein
VKPSSNNIKKKSCIILCIGELDGTIEMVIVTQELLKKITDLSIFREEAALLSLFNVKPIIRKGIFFIVLK